MEIIKYFKEFDIMGILYEGAVFCGNIARVYAYMCSTNPEGECCKCMHVRVQYFNKILNLSIVFPLLHGKTYF